MIDNKVILMGRLTKDVEAKTTQTDITVASFSIAVDKQTKGEDKEAIFVNCTAWRSTADYLAKYCSKGDKIAIEGHLDVNSWTDKEGNKRNDLRVIVENTKIIAKKKENVAKQVSVDNNFIASAQNNTDDDLPF